MEYAAQPLENPTESLEDVEGWSITAQGKVAKLSEAYGFSPEEIADAVGCAASTVDRWIVESRLLKSPRTSRTFEARIDDLTAVTRTLDPEFSPSEIVKVLQHPFSSRGYQTPAEEIREGFGADVQRFVKRLVETRKKRHE